MNVNVSPSPGLCVAERAQVQSAPLGDGDACRLDRKHIAQRAGLGAARRSTRIHPPGNA